MGDNNISEKEYRKRKSKNNEKSHITVRSQISTEKSHITVRSQTSTEKSHITTGNQIFTDAFGNIVSEEEYKKNEYKFNKYLNNIWERRANEIVNATKGVNDVCDKLKIIFKYLTSDRFEYVLQRSLDGRRAHNSYYGRVKEFPSYSIDADSKYPVLILGEGVCQNFSLAFKDLCKRIGVYCECIEGDTGMDHKWNAVVINGEILFVDVAYALMQKKNRIDPLNFFLKTNEEIIAISGYRKITSSLDELKKHAEEQKKIRASQNSDDKNKTKKSHIRIH